MDPYITEWISLLLRLLHVVSGVAWIGASFYFIWLDNHLQKPPQWKVDKGVGGDLWAIHGGGFYEVAKYKLAPPEIPETLHWFKWEAYTTWISGMFLLGVIYYAGAETYLIDHRVAALTQVQAIGIGLGVIVACWIIYDYLCSTRLAQRGIILGIILLALLTGLTYGLTQLFSARGAYIHVGVVIGTIMVGNVFRVIIPGQRAMVDAVKAGKQPDPSWGLKAKLRSTHNTYTTLPLIFIMISNHYPITYSHRYNWAILIALTIITAAVRYFFVLRHKGVVKPMILVLAAAATFALAVLVAPKSIKNQMTGSTQGETTDSETKSVIKGLTENSVNIAQVESILYNRCASCHSSHPTDDQFKVAPAGVLLDDLMLMRQWAPRIQARVIDAADMPLMNKTNMTEKERILIARWLDNELN